MKQIKSNPFEEMVDRFDRLEGLVIELINKDEPENDREAYLSRKQTAEYLGISLPTLSKKTKEGELNAFRLGGRILYKRVEIDEALNNNRAYPQNERT